MRLIYVIPTIVMLIALGVVPAQALTVGDPVPDFEITTLGGEVFSTSDFKGKNSMFLVFWATWCPSCRVDIKNYELIHSTFGPKGMKVLAVNPGVNDSLDRVKRYAKKYRISYPVAFDATGKLKKEFGLLGAPTIFIVDKKGIVRYRDATIPTELPAHFDALMED